MPIATGQLPTTAPRWPCDTSFEFGDAAMASFVDQVGDDADLGPSSRAYWRRNDVRTDRATRAFVATATLRLVRGRPATPSTAAADLDLRSARGGELDRDDYLQRRADLADSR